MNDVQIKGLFRSQKTEVADNGFSRRIVARLPRRGNMMPQVIVALFSLAGVAAIVAITGVKPLEELWKGVLLSFPGVSLTGTMMSTYLFTVAAVTIIGLSIRKAAA